MRALYYTLWSLIICVAVQAQPSDSVQLSRQVDAMKQDISDIDRLLQQQIQVQQVMMDSLIIRSQTQQKNHELLLKHMKMHRAASDTTKAWLTGIHDDTQSINHQLQRNSMISFILHAFSLALLLFLTVYIIIQRQRSLDFLLSNTKKLGGQNEEILEKAEELKHVKQSLKTMLEYQKRLNKNMKKKKKK